MATRHTYKVIFHNQGKIYEIFARSVHQSMMIGFIEIEELVFGARTTVVVDPSEENLKSEFNGVIRSYIPVHAIIRIDEVKKEGHGKIISSESAGEKIMPFPVFTPSGKTTE